MTAKKKPSTRKKAISLLQNESPSEVTEIYWLSTLRQNGKYPKQTENSGKWLVFAPIDKVDEVWIKIKIATENGLLGQASKVATAKENSNATNKNIKVICVYTYDYTDEQDVMRVRQELRKLGVTSKIPYKADRATREGKYSVKGNTNISEYYN
jgi:hypothetical protein